jgi:hypothetical protein
MAASKSNDFDIIDRRRFPHAIDIPRSCVFTDRCVMQSDLLLFSSALLLKATLTVSHHIPTFELDLLRLEKCVTVSNFFDFDLISLMRDQWIHPLSSLIKVSLRIY